MGFLCLIEQMLMQHLFLDKKEKSFKELNEPKGMNT